MTALSPAALRQASLIPRDAALVIEGRGDDGSAASSFGRWNPWCRFDTRRLGRLAEVPGEAVADCVTLDDGLATLEQPLEALRQARRLVKRQGAVLITLAEPTEQRLQRLAALCANAGLAVELAELLKDEAGGLGHAVVRAVRTDAALPRLFIQGMGLKPIGGVTDKRIAEPNDFLRTIPGVMAVTQVDTLRRKVHPGERVLVAQRRILRPGDIAGLRRTIAEGYLLVGEMDDHPDFLPGVAEGAYLGLRGMHAVQTSTPRLAETLRVHAAELAIFPNQLAELPPERTLPADGPVTVFFGAFNREIDWAPLMPEINRAIARHGERLRFVVVHDRGFFERVETTAKSFTPTCDYPRYLERLGGCDIALLPLSDHPFNHCKSDLKFIECAAHQVAVLASPTVYADSVDDGRTGLLFSDAEDFGRKFDRLVLDQAERHALAARARAWVSEHRLLARHFRARYDWYRSLLGRRAELTAALLARLDAISPT